MTLYHRDGQNLYEHESPRLWRDSAGVAYEIEQEWVRDGQDLFETYKSGERVLFLLSESGNALYTYSLDRDEYVDPTIALGSGGWRGAAAYEDRLYLADSFTDTLVAYDLFGTRHSSEDVMLGNLNPNGVYVTATRFYVLNIDGNVLVWNRAGVRQNSEEFDAGIDSEWVGITGISNRLRIIDQGPSPDVIRSFTYAGVEVVGEQIPLPEPTSPQGITTDESVYYVADGAADVVRIFDLDGTEHPSSERIDITNDAWNAIAFARR